MELSAYRIVEQLLDALEDAPDVEVRVRFGDDALELAVSGPARRAPKAAIERARERVQLHHGTLEATHARRPRRGRRLAARCSRGRDLAVPRARDLLVGAGAGALVALGVALRGATRRRDASLARASSAARSALAAGIRG